MLIILTAIVLAVLAAAAAYWIVTRPALKAVFATVEPGYAVGESVRFSLRNEGEITVTLPSSAPWSIERDVDGNWRSVETHYSAGMQVYVGRGETVSWSWKAESQQYPGLFPVEPAEYRIRLSLVGESPTMIELVCTFTLV